MSAKNDGDEAFPISTIDGYTAYGMSLRDYFAGQALAGIVPKISLMGVGLPGDVGAADIPDDLRKIIMDAVSRGAYQYADAMLEAREKD